MTIERMVRGLAGFMVLLSLVLGQFVSRWWLLLALFVSLNLLQSAFSNTCPAMSLLRRMGFKRCVSPDAGKGGGRG
ncbi:MAG: hypothetical protein PWQ57_1478 [Desulfovibrionales bacterium]|jgi:hypothetical protein|nr:hypothetical protein [Desulfovibrionales bacterium]